MYDAGKILPGLIVFLAIATFPIWYDLATGASAAGPEPIIVTQEPKCVESVEYMRASHMTLLESWREQVVREGKTVYTAGDRKQHEMSLSATCLKCHSNKAEFCDRCHDYARVKPACWDCHTAPEEKTAAGAPRLQARELVSLLRASRGGAAPKEESP